VTNLATESDLERELLRLYRKWDALGYRASRFYQTFTKGCMRYKGGVNAVVVAVSKTGAGGFERLREMRRLDLTLENRIVLNREWTHLFSNKVCIAAQRKMDAISK
jgi:hypothetical protein